MKKILLGLVFTMFAFQVNASIFNNGSFETGDLSGWTDNSTTGSSSVVTNSVSYGGTNYSATDGSYFVELTADSSLSQNISWAAGETMSFDWAFLAFDYDPYFDSSFFSVFNGASLVKALTLADVASVGDYGETIWNTFSYTFVNAGAGQMTFGVSNLGDNAFSSKLLIDNVSPSAVPVPAAVWLFGSALMGLFGVSRRKSTAVAA